MKQNHYFLRINFQHIDNRYVFINKIFSDLEIFFNVLYVYIVTNTDTRNLFDVVS